MLDKLTGLFSGAYQYVLAGLLAVILVLSTGIYVEHLRNVAKQGKLDAATADLRVSVQSITALTLALQDVHKQLDDEQQAEQKQKAQTAEALATVQRQDKDLNSLQHRLEERKSQSVCPIPKDLSNAWNAL